MNQTSIVEFERLLKRPEGINLEFKKAATQFNRDHDLPDYCAALANEGGGKLILGVDNSGRVTGTKAFWGMYNRLSNQLLDELGIRIDVEEIQHPNGRVLIFHVPGRRTGSVIRSTGHFRYPMRAGESLTEMDEGTIRKCLNETASDYSMRIVPDLGVNDLDEKAIDIFRNKWAEKQARKDYLKFSNEKLLRAAGLLTDEGISNAGLILFGKKEKIDRLMPDAEIIFEWRHKEGHITHDFRTAWREPFFLIFDKVWETINNRNIRTPFQQGFIQREIYAYKEKSIREAVLNAAAHRDYSITGASVMIKASPDSFTIISPGGFPEGITPENVLTETRWRNRLIAEAFEKAGLVERSGQGMDDIFNETIRDGKGIPDLSQSDKHRVVLSIPAKLKDKEFVLFIEKVINDKQISFTFEEMYELERIREHGKVSTPEYRNKFLNYGIIEKVGRAAGTKYLLSHHYYKYAGHLGIHTRLTGLSREQYKELIVNHIRKNGKGYMKDFIDAFQDLSRGQILGLLKSLRKEDKIICEGARKNGYWALNRLNTSK